MAPSATSVQSKMKRPLGIQTSGINGINSRTSSPSPSMSAGRLPSGTKHPTNGATNNGIANGARSVKDRIRRDGPPQLLGRGQRNSSVGLRSASIIGESVAAPISEQPYVKSDQYILKKFRGNPPSLIIHLHPTHFRFDQQEGSFTYTSPMKIVLEHIRKRTIPHELIEFMPEVPFYEGCMIVQVYDHKTHAPSTEATKAKPGTGKSVLCSIHNYNVYLTPSPYVPYEPNTPSKKGKDNEGDDINPKSTEQKDKETMPAPSLPSDSQRKQSGGPTKKVYSVVLRPTPLSNYVDLANKAAETRANMDSRRDSRQDVNGPLSATVPPTPSTAIPSTPLTSMPPPAKRVKKSKLDHSNIYAAESQIVLATTAPLLLEPAESVLESAAILDALSHPMHAEKPPSPKTRKRTVAEMAADEAAAAEHERYMLYFDERLSGSARGAQRGSNAADGSGQAAGAAFEPRFERFQTLEGIKIQHEENKRLEKQRKEEADRKQQQDLQRNKLRDEAEKREQEKTRNLQLQQAQAQQRQEAQRRAQATQAQQNMQGSLQGPHAHPQSNGFTPNVMAAQPQRFHQQQVSQNQTSSPIVRNGTPQNHSSPTVNNMGNVPMQQSTSSMGGSPARPGSVVHQNHPQLGGHAMNAQRSQQSHAGTPRMPPTPNVQSTPLNRPMNQTPRMSQGSPLQGTMAQTPQMPVMTHQQMQIGNAQAAQQQAFQNQQRMQMMMRNQQQVAAQQQAAAAAAAQGMGGGMLNAQQQQLMQAQMLRNQQAQQLGQGNYSQMQQQMAAALAARSGAMPQGMGQNFIGNNSPMVNPMQQMSGPQLQQMQQLQQMRAAQAAQQQQQAMQGQGQPMSQQQLFQRHVITAANQIYQHQKQLYMQQHPQGLPHEMDAQLKNRAHQAAQQQVQQRFQKQREQQIMAQQQQQQQQQQQMNGMQQGMGM